MPDLEEGWRINGEGLEYASMLGYQIYIGGVEFLASQGNFPARLLNALETCRASPANIRGKKEQIPPEIAPMLVKFLRPEIAILGVDLVEYGPFREGEVTALPYAHAKAFVDNGAAEMFGG